MATPPRPVLNSSDVEDARTLVGMPDDVYERLIASLSDYAVLLLSPEGIVLTWNRGAELIKGYRPEEIIGSHFRVFYTHEAVSVEHPKRELETAALVGRYDEEGWRVRADGTRFWAHVVITPIYDDDDDDELTGYSKVTQDRTARKQSEEQVKAVHALLEQTARMDSLTGLDNRRAWDEALKRELARARRQATPLSVGIIDLDHFKLTNDRRGHEAGDRLLKRAAVAWKRALLPSDVIARYGGEEFAVAIPGCPLRDAVAVLERLRAATPDEQTCSIGVALWDGSENASVLLGRADRAMYRAKDEGRDRLCAADTQDAVHLAPEVVPPARETNASPNDASAAG